jgi:hypothetical protein
MLHTTSGVQEHKAIFNILGVELQAMGFTNGHIVATRCKEK